MTPVYLSISKNTPHEVSREVYKFLESHKIEWAKFTGGVYDPESVLNYPVMICVTNDVDVSLNKPDRVLVGKGMYNEVKNHGGKYPNSTFLALLETDIESDDEDYVLTGFLQVGCGHVIDPNDFTKYERLVFGKRFDSCDFVKKILSGMIKPAPAPKYPFVIDEDFKQMKEYPFTEDEAFKLSELEWPDVEELRKKLEEIRIKLISEQKSRFIEVEQNMFTKKYNEFLQDLFSDLRSERRLIHLATYKNLKK